MPYERSGVEHAYTLRTFRCGACLQTLVSYHTGVQVLSMPTDTGVIPYECSGYGSLHDIKVIGYKSRHDMGVMVWSLRDMSVIGHWCHRVWSLRDMNIIGYRSRHDMSIMVWSLRDMGVIYDTYVLGQNGTKLRNLFLNNIQELEKSTQKGKLRARVRPV